MDADAVSSAALSGVPGALLAGVVDLQTGLFVALESGNCLPEEADRLAVSVRELFAGDSMAALRQAFSNTSGSEQVSEALVLGGRATFMFARVPHDRDAVVVVACHRESNVGMILATTRHLVRTA